MSMQGAGQGFGVAQADRLVARFNGFESAYGNSRHSDFMLRMRRGTSWLARAEEDLFGRETPDPDAAFVFYWIAFNSVYADNKVDGTDKYERDRFKAYFNLLLCCDKSDRIYGALRNKLPRDVLLSFINNRYLYWRFWKYHGGDRRNSRWQAYFESENRAAERALARVMPRGSALSSGAVKERNCGGWVAACMTVLESAVF